jgi:predicted secreted protein
MAMNRAQFKKELQEGLNTVFGLEYRRKKETWRQYLDVETENRKAYVEDQMLAGLAVAPVKAEGTPIVYDSTSELGVARYFFETIALAFAITEEAEEDNLYGSIGAKLSRALARSMQHTKAIKCANILNNGFDATNFAFGWDGKPLFSTSHLGEGAQVANKLATPADLSETIGSRTCSSSSAMRWTTAASRWCSRAFASWCRRRCSSSRSGCSSPTSASTRRTTT